MSAETNWDRLFGAVGGRLFTIGALIVAIAVATIGAFVSPVLFDMPATYADAHHGDIDAFIRAGEMAIAGDAAAAYDPATFTSRFAEANRGLLWFYPPHTFFAVAPLGAAPYVAARPLWIALTFISMLAVVRVSGMKGALPLVIVALSPAVFVSQYFLQAGAFVALALAASLMLAPARPIAAGVLLGLLTVKPQYGLLIPVFLAGTGQWRTFGAAAATCLALVLLSALAFGFSSWSAYFASLARDQAPFFALAQPATASVGQLAVKVGAAPAAAIGAQIAAVAAAATATFVAARRLDYPVASGLAVLLSLAAAPSSWTYDWPILAAALMMIAAARGAWPWPMQALALAAWVAPFAPMLSFSSVAAPILLAALAASMATYLFKTGFVPAKQLGRA